MNDKGFTLTELIVTMALVTLISMISYPAITNLQRSSKQQIYESYEKVLVNGAKLYVDKYDRDLFVRNQTGSQCVVITYDDLVNENLIKEYNGNKGETINKDKTFVNATKENGKLKYNFSLYVNKGNAEAYSNNDTLIKCKYIKPGS
ncbi:MAG: prepilin-type N-terminal cleavage/methylation domain-containing protein [bacterium]|nr:prepilin-type N-terminal cleavage/methylation domain-containing protein [bacterium]